MMWKGRRARAQGRRALMTGGAGAALLGLVSLAQAQPAPDTANGRFTLSPSGDGFVRLDTRTGTVSTCTNKGGWSCRMVPDERAALDEEIGRLQAENRSLKDEIARRDAAAKAEPSRDAAKAAPPGDGAKKQAEKQADAAPGTLALPVPAEHEKLMALANRLWERLVEMAGHVQKKLAEKI